MIKWAAHHILWFIIRMIATLACCYTINGLMIKEGYRIDIKDLLIAAACIVVFMRFWLPKPYNQKKLDKETLWSDYD
jgi:predicted nucleic acid-binding protein